ncbi:hypothetical protein A3218_05600 [Pseudomonas chlororaphis]|nr:hypothetical protein A3218_05600 [Pseudomonas chlororaphis]
MAIALIVVLPSAGISVPVKVEIHAPWSSAVTECSALPHVTFTELLGSAVPLTVTPAVFSVALTMLSPATVAIVGTATVVSTVTARVPAVETLPARSVAIAMIVVLPSAGTSVPEKVVDHLPSAATLTVLSTAPHATFTVSPA